MRDSVQLWPVLIGALPFWKMVNKDIYYLFIYFIFGCVGSQLQHAGSSLRHAGSFLAVRASLQLWRVGFLFSSCGAWVPEHVDSVVYRMQALVEACELSSCGVWA